MAKKIVPQERDLFQFTDEVVDGINPDSPDKELVGLVEEYDRAIGDDGEFATEETAEAVVRAVDAIEAYHRRKARELNAGE